MKKISLLLVLLLTSGLLSACGGSEGGSETAATTEPPKTTEERLPDVKLTFEKEQLADEQAFITEMEQYGAEVVDMSDAGGGYICTFGNDEYKKLLDDKHAAALKSFKEIEASETGYIEKIEYNEDFRDLQLYVNREKYDSADSKFSEYSVAAKALAYQLYLGEVQRTFVKVYYSDTEEAITSFSVPMSAEIS